MCNHSHEVPDADKDEIKEVTRILIRDMLIIVSVCLLIITLVWTIPGVKDWIKNRSANKEKSTAVTK